MKSLANKAKNAWHHIGFQKYLKNTSWMFFGQLSSIISLVLNIWLARYLGPDKYGTISYIFAFVGIFSFIANFGIGEILTRELVRHPEKKNKLMGTSAWMLAFGGVLAFLLSSGIALGYENDPLTKTLILAYSTIFIFSPVNVISAFFQSKVQAKKNAQVQIYGTILVSIFKAFLILSGKGIIWIIFAFVLDYLVGAILYLYIYMKNNFKVQDWEFDMQTARTFFSSSFLLILSGATGYLLLRIDQVMIKFYMEKEAVGIYAVGVRFSEIWYFIPGIISNSIFPAIVNAKKVSKELYHNRLRNLYLFLGSAAIAIALPMTVLAPYLIKFLYGDAYLQSIPVLQIYIWSGVGLFLITGINKFLIAENHLKSIFFYNLIPAIINITLNVILIPKIGILGAAWATFISYSIGPIFIFLIYKLKLIPHHEEQ